MMRVLACIPHFFRRNSPDSGKDNGSNQERLEKRLFEVRHCYRQLNTVLARVHFTLGSEDRIANGRVEAMPQPVHGDVIMVSIPSENLLDELGKDGRIRAFLWDGPPRQLGYHCRRIFARHVDQYDLYCFIEDDTAILDFAFFRKAAKFYQTHGEDKILLPNRYEIFGPQGRGWRAFLDHPTFPHLQIPERPGPETVSLPHFDGEVVFRKTRDGQAGAYVITNAQLKEWMQLPGFGAPSAAQLQAGYDPMELAMIPMGGHLPIYRADYPNLDFFEVHHVPVLASTRRTPARKLGAYLAIELK
jgi:hypothetical protein